MSLSTVTLTFAVQDAADDAETGDVTITPTSVVTAAGVTVVSQDPVVRAFSAGTCSVQVVACDSSGTSPAAGFWAYLIALPGWTAPKPYLVNFANGATQRFDSLTPAVASTTYGPAASSGAVSSVFGRTGTVTAQSGDYTAAQTGALAGSNGVPAAALAPDVITLTDGSSVAIDASQGNVFSWPLGGSSHTLAVPANPKAGQAITVWIAYGGSFTPLFNAVYDFGASGQPSWTATSGKKDHAAFQWDGAAWCFHGAQLGFSS